MRERRESGRKREGGREGGRENEGERASNDTLKITTQTANKLIVVIVNFTVLDVIVNYIVGILRNKDEHAGYYHTDLKETSCMLFSETCHYQRHDS